MGLFSLILLLTLTANLYAQGSDWLFLLPRWNTGEQRTLTITYGQRITRNDTLLQERADSTYDQLEVLTATTSGYTLRWMAERFRMDLFTDAPELQGVVDQVLARANRLEMEFRVRPTGQLTGLRNWLEVQQVYFAVFDHVETALRQDGMQVPDRDIDQMVSGMKQRIEQRVQVEHTALHPYRTLFNAYNVAIHRDSVKRQETDVPIDLASRPVPGVLETRILELTDSIATLETTTRVDPDQARTEINEYLKFREALGEEAFEPLGSGAFYFRETSTYTFERMTGWWKEVSFTAHTQINETHIEQIVRYQFGK